MFTWFSANADIQAISHCWQDAPMNAVFHRHFHTNYELLLVIAGNVHYHIDGERYALKPYDLLLIPASTYHFLIPISNAPYESYVLNFSPEFIAQKMQPLFSQPRILNIARDSTLQRVFAQLDLYHQMYTDEDFEKASGFLLNELLLYAGYTIQTRAEKVLLTDSHPLIARVTAYIADHLREELSSDIIAKELNFSKSHIQNVFSAVMKIGLQQYVNQKKIHAAHHDIQNGLSSGEAAEKYGYHNYSSFYRQYKKFFGHSPKDGQHQ